MKKIFLIITSLFVFSYGGESSTDTVKLSKTFMKALMTMDEKTIEEMKHSYADSGLSKKYFLDAEHKALKASNITIEQLQYTTEQGKNNHVCVIVKSIDTRKTSYGLLPIHWRLGFAEDKDKNKDGLSLYYLNSINEANGYYDEGCW